MSQRLRLWLCAGIIVVSALYAVLVDKDRELAETVAIGYIAVVLTVIAIISIWKKP